MRNPLHSLCPYFAMFPESFVERHLNTHTEAGDVVFDPFSGRGTTLLQSLLMNRQAGATDVNPVAYCISAAKSFAPNLVSVRKEIDRLEAAYHEADLSPLSEERLELPLFFAYAFHEDTLKQLLFLRRALNWRNHPSQRFISALCLGSLHGEINTVGSYFSNQMPRTISTKPEYSIRYWQKNGQIAPARNVFSVLRQRANMRLADNVIAARGKVKLMDARKASSVFPEFRGRVKAVVTSPPYFDVTNYAEDQWLRLWFLGHDPNPTYGTVSGDDRHTRLESYWRFLCEVWRGIGPLMMEQGVLVCRIGAKDIQPTQLQEGLLHSLRPTFPQVALVGVPEVSEIINRQTDAFRPGSRGCRLEVDFTFRL